MKKSASYCPEDPLLTAQQAAAELGIGVSTFWRDVRRGRWPAPYRPAPKAPRWRLSEIRAILASYPPGTGATGTAGVGMVATNPQPK